VTVPVALPKGTLSINALPWADVTLDGQPMGQTPLGNLSVTIGNHEVVWKHPQLGERRQTVKVTAGAPVRAGMDLTK
jgi:serine/threonine-protein kinase